MSFAVAVIVLFLLHLFQRLLEPFGKGDDNQFGLNSELFSSLQKGTTLVEYRWGYSFIFLNFCPFCSKYPLQIINVHMFAALQISLKSSTLGTCALQLLAGFYFNRVYVFTLLEILS